MPQTIQIGAEMLRINPAKNTIEYSTNNGRSWHTRCSSSSYGSFKSLLCYGAEILIASSKGVLYSTNEGRSVHMRSSATTNTGGFNELMDGGNELLADTTKGLLYSTNSGRSWHMRKRK